MDKIIILAPYPAGSAPSQRFRFEQYIPCLEKEFEVEFHSFIDDKMWSKLYSPGLFFYKARKMVQSFFKRVILLPKIAKSDYVFIHREASQIGPPVFEWIIAKVLRKKYIFDFDDAIWIPNFSETNATFQRLKAYWKVKFIIKWAGQVSAGNNFLADYAKQFNSAVVIIPTTIDTINHHNQKTSQTEEPLRIGWTGSHTTMSYLPFLEKPLQELEKKYAFLFRVISNEAPSMALDSLEYIKWNKETEIEDLSKIQIGVMPLEEDKWSSGKCAFKALQYMALEIPTVLSPVGVNKEVIEHEVSGFFASKQEEWTEILEELILKEELRRRIGERGKRTIEEKYSVSALTSSYLNLFK